MLKIKLCHRRHKLKLHFKIYYKRMVVIFHIITVYMYSLLFMNLRLNKCSIGEHKRLLQKNLSDHKHLNSIYTETNVMLTLLNFIMSRGCTK